MREDFEEWYLKTYLVDMPTGKESITFLRNESGDYENDHMQGSWDCYKMRRAWADHTIGFNVSFSSRIAAVLVMIFIFSVCGALYFICFSPSLYAFAISLCGSCK